MPITVSIVEDDRGTRENLMALLNQAPSLHCISSHATGEDALEKIPLVPPDVALVDINLPGMDGIGCVARLKAQLPGLVILILTRHDDTDMVFDALRAGASGFLLKSRIGAELIPAIEQAQAGGAPMSPQIARKVVGYFSQIKTPPDVERLSKREQEVLALLAKGFLYKEIGDMLGISLETVRMHLKHIYHKLHVRSRTEAAAKYFGR
ncbi:MAG: response regulator transcription factor [Verrucomicrobia bacterium]|nr:response regulator transcription factor [Verrucomicrobiota bacterium]MDE3100533.1 response regulator transcription factor [Verrucomicrobiota bacterium]